MGKKGGGGSRWMGRGKKGRVGLIFRLLRGTYIHIPPNPQMSAPTRGIPNVWKLSIPGML
jgi:hypothetical protein